MFFLNKDLNFDPENYLKFISNFLNDKLAAKCGM